METERQTAPADPASDDLADRQRQAPVAMTGEQFRQLGHQLVDDVAAFLDSLPERPVTRDPSAAALRALLGDDAPLPDQGEDAAALLAQASRLLFEHSLFNGHPRFYGYITAPATPIGVLGELL